MNAVEFRNVSVCYRRHRVPTLKEWVIGTVRGTRVRQDFTALKEVSLDVAAGRSLGIVGGNGAGKSTLLRVAAGIIVPSEGECVVRGTLAPLIELGAGFDLELTGRENIIFNGALLGRPRREMLQRSEEIIEFAGLAEFIDAPLRTYSTGMVARLAFAIATTVDAETVLLDEILAVGDAAFRDKCTDRIRSFARRGATILLVSHELPSILELCDDAIWIEGGVIRAAGPAPDVVEAYSRAMHAVAPLATPSAVTAAAL